MQEIFSSNPSAVTGICDPNKSRARHHRSLKLGSKLKYLKRWKLMRNFSDAVNWTFRISDWFFKSFLDTNFQFARISKFWLFSPVLEFIRMPCLNSKRDSMLKKFPARAASTVRVSKSQNQVFKNKSIKEG